RARRRKSASARPANDTPTGKLTPLDESLVSSFAGRRCLVTGGLGFIGSNLALALSAGGAEVTVVDALVPTHGGDRGNLDEAAGPIDVIDAQVDDVGLVRDAAAASEVIFNLAGQVSHVESMARPRFDLEVNTASQQGFLPIFIRRALSDEPITVFGDGAQERDCLYVADVVECLLLTARSAEAPGEVFNVGNDEHLSLRTIAEAIVVAAGSGSVESVP